MSYSDTGTWDGRYVPDLSYADSYNGPEKLILQLTRTNGDVSVMRGSVVPPQVSAPRITRLLMRR